MNKEQKRKVQLQQRILLTIKGYKFTFCKKEGLKVIIIYAYHHMGLIKLPHQTLYYFNIAYH
jgi:hypothetical protein